MMPVVAGARETKRQMLAYTVALLPVAASPWFLGAAGPLYLLGSTAFGIAFVGTALRVLREDDEHLAGDKAAKQMFGFSILYLFALFALLIVDAVG
jgi:protoheme IX farnesyltransferase